MTVRIATSLLIALALLASATPSEGQALNEEFLRSTALITFGKSAGTGFFLFRPVHGDQGHVLLITNKHALPPIGTPQSIQIRVTLGTGDKAAVRFVDIPIVGAGTDCTFPMYGFIRYQVLTWRQSM
ncbi:MAG: hypothetical protein KJ550_09605 [Proteobacteria bacterium]|nr:hypothetical protein [Desulfobacteraceae bacterium]MBU4013710.1 hypothetical protein [Pseudomonadota bacterium]MBU4127078.1 hypothetical protein [Pseudomonadota bacterium]MBU4319384.1 hypothetical protein [Pseudomonadota bacterium]